MPPFALSSLFFSLGDLVGRFDLAIGLGVLDGGEVVLDFVTGEETSELFSQ